MSHADNSHPSGEAWFRPGPRTQPQDIIHDEYATPKAHCCKCGIEVFTEDNPAAWTLPGDRLICDNCDEARSRSLLSRFSESLRLAFNRTLPPRKWWRLSPPYALRRWYAGVALCLVAIGFAAGYYWAAAANQLSDLLR